MSCFNRRRQRSRAVVRQIWLMKIHSDYLNIHQGTATMSFLNCVTHRRNSDITYVAGEFLAMNEIGMIIILVIYTTPNRVAFATRFRYWYFALRPTLDFDMDCSSYKALDRFEIISIMVDRTRCVTSCLKWDLTMFVELPNSPHGYATPDYETDILNSSTSNAKEHLWVISNVHHKCCII